MAFLGMKTVCSVSGFLICRNMFMLLKAHYDSCVVNWETGSGHPSGDYLCHVNSCGKTSIDSG